MYHIASGILEYTTYSRSRSFHDDLILQDQASGERSQDHWSSGIYFVYICLILYFGIKERLEKSLNTDSSYNRLQKGATKAAMQT